MVPKRQAAPREEGTPQTAPAVVLTFPTGKRAAPEVKTKSEANGTSAVLSSAPIHGERPTHVVRGLPEWLRATLIVSVAVHALAYVAFELRFEDDLERAAGAAASLSGDGSVTIPIEIVAESMLPSAPAPTDASESETVQPSPPPAEQAEAEIDHLMPPIPEPAPVVLPEPDIAKLMPPPPDPAPVVLPKPPEFAASMMPPPPEPAPVVLLMRAEAAHLALPEEDTAPPQAVETASIPEGPAPSAELDEEPPMPAPREPPPSPAQAKKPPEKHQQQKPERQQAARSAPSKAASPSRAAGANSTGRAGAGGAAETGGRAAVSSYQRQVLTHLSRYQFYPSQARRRGATGVARVKFMLGRDGRLISVQLHDSSGERDLDEAAVAIVQRAAPFPPFPPTITQTRMNFPVPMRFDLR